AAFGRPVDDAGLDQVENVMVLERFVRTDMRHARYGVAVAEQNKLFARLPGISCFIGMGAGTGEGRAFLGRKHLDLLADHQLAIPRDAADDGIVARLQTLLRRLLLLVLLLGRAVFRLFLLWLSFLCHSPPKAIITLIRPWIQ